MKGYKTVIFNIAAVITTIGTLIGVDIPAAQLDTFAGAVVSAITAGNVILRAVTTSPIFKKE